MSDDQYQEHGAGQPAALPQADGPLVDVTLPDGQHLYAVVKARIRETDGWWYALQIHLPSQGSERGRLLVLPAAVDFLAPAALCEPATRAAIEEAHRVAAGEALAWVEDSAIVVLSGPGGIKREQPVGGLVVARFRHHDSRHRMPLLHDHLVVSVKVLRADGKWGHLDSRTLCENVVTAGALYNQRVLEEVCDRLGLATEPRAATLGRRPVMEIAGVPAEVIAWSSTRDRDTRQRLAVLEAEYTADHGSGSVMWHDRFGCPPHPSVETESTVPMSRRSSLCARDHLRWSRRVCTRGNSWRRVGSVALIRLNEHQDAGAWGIDSPGHAPSMGIFRIRRAPAAVLVLLAACLTTGISANASDRAAARAGVQAGTEHVALHAAVAELPVTAEDRTGYNREQSFGGWIDADHDGCNTRKEVLLEVAVTAPTVTGACTLSGGSWWSWYDDTEVDNASALDIDHLVPLAEAWDSGASAWTKARRVAYANYLDDPRHLVAVTARSNRQKSDQDPATWMPPAADAVCRYTADWISVKLTWHLAVDPPEQTALARLAGSCPDQGIPYTTAT